MPNWLVPIGFVRGAITLLAEVLMLEVVSEGNMCATTKLECVVLVSGVGVAMFE